MPRETKARRTTRLRCESKLRPVPAPITPAGVPRIGPIWLSESATHCRTAATYCARLNNPTSAGAMRRELIARGHSVTYFHMADLEERVTGEGLGFVPIGQSDHPKGSLPERLDR